MHALRRSLLFAALLPACTWTPTPGPQPIDTGDAPAPDCGALTVATGFSVSFGQFTVDNEPIPVTGALDYAACADPTLATATWPLQVDDVYAGTLALSVASSGGYTWPDNPPTQLTITLDAPSYGVTGTFSSWAFGTLQVTDSGETITVNLPNLASASDAPSVNVSGSFSVTR